MLNACNKRTIIFVFTSLILLISPTFVNATVVWEDNFDDNNLDDWPISYGLNYTEFVWQDMDSYVGASNGELVFSAPNQPQEGTRPVSTADGHFFYVTQLCRPSTAVTGHWSLDVRLGVSQTPTFIQFISDAEDFRGTTEAQWDAGEVLKNTYVVGLDLGVGTVGLGKSTETIVNKSRYIDPSQWTHVDITRSSSGEMKVYIDNGLVLSATDNTLSSSTHFCLQASRAKIDNVVLSDNSSYVPPLPETTSEVDDGPGFTVLVVTASVICINIIKNKRR